MVVEKGTHPGEATPKPVEGKEIGETLKDFWQEPRTRRGFLKLVAVTAAGSLLGWSFLRRPKEKQLSALVPGKSHLPPLSPGKLSQEAGETVPPKEAKEVKKFEGIKIELITDESLKTREKNPIQEITYKDPIEGPKAMEKALLLTWAYALKDRVRGPGFQDIPEEDVDSLITTLTEKLNQGEDLSFFIYLKEDYSDRSSPAKPYKVDLSQGVNINFVGKVDEKFVIPFYLPGKEHIPGYGFKYETDPKNALTIKIFDGPSADINPTEGVYLSFTYLITQNFEFFKPKGTPKEGEWYKVTYPYPHLIDILFPGWLKSGTIDEALLMVVE